MKHLVVPVALIRGNSVVLLGRILREGTEAFAGPVKIVFAVLTLAYPAVKFLGKP